MIRTLAPLLAAAGLGASATASLPLNQLSDCASLAQVLHQLAEFPRACAPPQGAIQRYYDSYLRPAPGNRVCFLPRAPSSALSGFGCLVTQQDSKIRQMICIRPASSEAIANYRDHYSDYEDAVRGYLTAASACRVGNGDATAAPRTLALPLILRIARPRVLFALPTGKGIVGSSVFVHGFGKADPDLLHDDDAAIEWVSVWVNQ